MNRDPSKPSEDNFADHFPDNFPDEELAELWNRQETPMANTADFGDMTKLAASVRADHHAAQRSLLWLNVREVIPATLVGAYFAFLGTVEESASVLYLSSLLCFGVAAVLVWSTVRQHQMEQHFDTTLRGSVERSLSQARHRFRMYRTAGWWYVAPFGLAVAILYAWAVVDDPNGAKPSDAIAILFTLAILALLVWWNRRVAFTKWQPEVERFEAMLADLDGT